MCCGGEVQEALFVVGQGVAEVADSPLSYAVVGVLVVAGVAALVVLGD